MTARDYDENVFSFGDIFDASRFQPTLDSGKVEVIVLESLWFQKKYFLCASKCGDIILVHFSILRYGRCYGLKYRDVATSDWVTIGLRAEDEVSMALMEDGQVRSENQYSIYVRS